MVQIETAFEILMFRYRTPEVLNHQDLHFLTCVDVVIMTWAPTITLFGNVL